MVSMGLQKIEEGTSDDAFTEDAIRDTAGSIFTGKDGLLDSLQIRLMLPAMPMQLDRIL